MESTKNYSKFATSNQSTDKVLSIIELLAYSKEPVRLTDIAKELDSNSSTVLRFLNSLEHNGYVFKDTASGGYYMTYKICSLASSINRNTDIVSSSIPFIKKISAYTQECVCLSVEEGDSIVFVYVSEAPTQMLHTIHRVGTYAPLHCTGAGKVFLADKSDEELDGYILRRGLQKFNDNTITTRDKLLLEMNATRFRDYGLDNEECEDGVRCIGLPIRNYTGRVIASISITGPASRITDEYITKNIAELKTIAHSLSNKLGFSEAGT